MFPPGLVGAHGDGQARAIRQGRAVFARQQKVYLTLLTPASLAVDRCSRARAASTVVVAAAQIGVVQRKHARVVAVQQLDAGKRAVPAARVVALRLYCR